MKKDAFVLFFNVDQRRGGENTRYFPGAKLAFIKRPAQVETANKLIYVYALSLPSLHQYSYKLTSPKDGHTYLKNCFFF